MGWIKFLTGKKTPGKTNSLREAILTIWRELTQSVEEGRKYEFHNLYLKNFLVRNCPQHLIQLQ